MNYLDTPTSNFLCVRLLFRFYFVSCFFFGLSLFHFRLKTGKRRRRKKPSMSFRGRYYVVRSGKKPVIALWLHTHMRANIRIQTIYGLTFNRRGVYNCWLIDILREGQCDAFCCGVARTDRLGSFQFREGCLMLLIVFAVNILQWLSLIAWKSPLVWWRNHPMRKISHAMT